MAKRAAKKEEDDEPDDEPESPSPSPVKNLIANVANGLAGGWKDRLVRGVARPLAGGFVLGVGLAVAFGMAFYETFHGLAGLIVAPYSDSIRPFAQGLVTLLMIGAIAFVGIRLATRGRGRDAVKFCPACLEHVPLAATKCRACGTDL